LFKKYLLAPFKDKILVIRGWSLMEVLALANKQRLKSNKNYIWASPIKEKPIKKIKNNDNK